MAGPESLDDPPSFKEPFSGDDVEQCIYGTILQPREPTTVSAIAEEVDCDPKIARKYLDWFDDLGIVTCPDWQQRSPEGGCKHLRRVDHEIKRSRVPRPDGRLPTTSG